MLADTAALQRDLVALQQYTPRAEETAGRFQHRLYQAIAVRAQGVTRHLSGEFDEARAVLRQALSIFRSFNARWQMARTLLELGRVAQQQGDIPEATAVLSEALVLARALHANPLAGQIAHLLGDGERAAPGAESTNVA